MTKEELKNIFAALRAVYPHWQISTELFQVWHKILGTWSYEVVSNAAQNFLSKPHPFPPTPGQINELCEQSALPAILRMSPEEAYEHKAELLTIEAIDFANRVVPDNPHHQYGSIEELHKANAIRKAQWKKAFAQRFEQKKGDALALIRIGWEAEQAMNRAVCLPIDLQHKLNARVKDALKIAMGAQ